MGSDISVSPSAAGCGFCPSTDVVPPPVCRGKGRRIFRFRAAVRFFRRCFQKVADVPILFGGQQLASGPENVPAAVIDRRTVRLFAKVVAALEKVVIGAVFDGVGPMPNSGDDTINSGHSINPHFLARLTRVAGSLTSLSISRRSFRDTESASAGAVAIPSSRASDKRRAAWATR